MSGDGFHEQNVTAKRNAKNSVFLDLFHNKKYLLQLYRVLHPEDTGATEDSLNIVTISNILMNGIYNDLGFLARENKLLLLVEAQSTWTVNILLRILLYLAQTYHEYCRLTNQSLYNGKKVSIPRPELYVIYIGERGDKPDVISLSKEFLGGDAATVEVTAKVVYYEQGSDNIINQYIVFCRVLNEQVKKYGRTKEAIAETIRICKDRDVLKEYLSSKEVEVTTIMMSLLNQEDAVDQYVNAKVYEADRATALRMIKMGKNSVEEIAYCVPSVSLDEIMKMKEEALQLA